jgi:orotidine-5'-phosphate decarboxylase
MDRSTLIQSIKEKKSVLCVGLDTDLEKIPVHLHNVEDPIFSFNKEIIDATAAYTVAYKPNIAFYEAEGIKGWKSLDKTIRYIREKYPTIFLIADAKRGDIGNTAERYAKTFYHTYNFDSVTLSPYMGKDSIEPFLQDHGKWAIVLGLTSNQGALDVQMLNVDQPISKPHVYQKVMQNVASWGNESNTMFVVGATNGAQLGNIRQAFPRHFFLIPGVGAQGGDLSEVLKHTFVKNEGLVLINSSRGILYASSEENFAQAAAAEAKKLQEEMAKWF